MVQTFQSLNLSSSTPQIEKLLISFVSSGNGDVMLTGLTLPMQIICIPLLLSCQLSGVMHGCGGRILIRDR